VPERARDPVNVLHPSMAADRVRCDVRVRRRTFDRAEAVVATSREITADGAGAVEV
jgi:hypothetical protein